MIIGYCCNCESELEADNLEQLEICDNCGSNDIKIEEEK